MTGAGVSLFDKRQLRAAFGRAAETYDQAARLQRDIADELLQRLDIIRMAPHLILDLGCGTGYSGRLLARRYRDARLIGLDIARSMAQRADRKSGLFSRQRFVCGDAEALPLASASVDMVVSNFMLQWCDPRAVFSEVMRVLKPGGLWMFSSFGPDTLKELRAAWQVVDEAVHVHGFVDMHDLGDQLVALGFSDPVLDVERLTLGYPDVMTVLRDLKHLGAHNVARQRTRGLTGKQRFARFMAAYAGLVPGGVAIPATYEVVYGQAWAPEKRGEGRDTRDEGWKPVSVFKRMSSSLQRVSPKRS
jgi:malonyl-CoA O-methyltransferase